MDWAVFGLARDPFQRSAELDDACLPNTISALLSELLSSLRSPKGVSVLVGDGGTGKSMAAAAFIRRAGGSADVAYLPAPTSCVTAIARDALSQFDPHDFDFASEQDWIPALRACVERCTRAGRTTVILLDQAHRLSPQTLQDLSEYFAEDETLRLHLILFGRPKLLDRLQAGAEDALRAHLLQICRLEPLGVRESVRYLERRVAICGGELATILSDEAIDEIVQKATGCVIRLEELTIEAVRRASRKGAVRATVVDVVATARTADAEEEDEVMARAQQPLRFAIEEDGIDEEEVSWGDEGDDRSVEWGEETSTGKQEEWQADDEDDEREWQADDEAEGDDDEQPLEWDASPPRRDLVHELRQELRVDLDDDLDEDLEEDDVAASAPRQAAGARASRRRLAGPAMLSLAACLALVWAANQMPGPDVNERRGRDSVMFAERLSSEPSQIMRLATTAEAADADAHVHVWDAQPPRPVVASSPWPEPIAVARAAEAQPHAMKNRATTTDAKPAAPASNESFIGPMPERPAEIEVSASKSQPASTRAKAPESAEQKPKTAAAGSASAKPVASAAAGRKAPVYTVQLGAFKARRNAEDMVTKLRGKSPRILQEGGLYRVMSGSFGTKKDAVIHEASLRRAGYTTYVRTAIF
jgi:type II secretory pathway predicted ATPase ExeA/cell division protein FtsN